MNSQNRLAVVTNSLVMKQITEGTGWCADNSAPLAFRSCFLSHLSQQPNDFSDSSLTQGIPYKIQLRSNFTHKSFHVISLSSKVKSGFKVYLYMVALKSNDINVCPTLLVIPSDKN